MNSGKIYLQSLYNTSHPLCGCVLLPQVHKKFIEDRKHISSQTFEQKYGSRNSCPTNEYTLIGEMKNVRTRQIYLCFSVERKYIGKELIKTAFIMYKVTSHHKFWDLVQKVETKIQSVNACFPSHSSPLRSRLYHFYH